MCQTIIITPYEELHSTPDIAAERAIYTAPLSEHFIRVTSVPAAEASLQMGYQALTGTFSNSGKPKANNNRYSHVKRTGRVSEVTIEGAGTDGAMPKFGDFDSAVITADIHWDLFLKVWADSNPLPPKAQFGGRHDRYPAYEIIVQQADGTFTDIHRRPPDTGAKPGPISLSGLNPVFVSGSKTITQ